MEILNIIKNYDLSVENLKKEKENQLRFTITEIFLTLTEYMREFGWNKIGKGFNTETIVKNHILKIDFQKNYNGEDVKIHISINLHDDYICDGGYNLISLKGSKPINSKHWYDQGKGSPVDFDENKVFFIRKQLQIIDDTYGNI
jgi:hypothetical protein